MQGPSSSAPVCRWSRAWRLDNLTRAIAEELRAVEQETSLHDAARLDSLRSLQERVWRCFETGELDASHHGMLMGAIRESMNRITEATVNGRHLESEGGGDRGGAGRET